MDERYVSSRAREDVGVLNGRVAAADDADTLIVISESGVRVYVMGEFFAGDI